ncbi:hypothetical protein V8G54_015183, partial [Vigna mungo]
SYCPKRSHAFSGITSRNYQSIRLESWGNSLKSQREVFLGRHCLKLTLFSPFCIIFCILFVLKAKAMGVTDFINLKDEKKPLLERIRKMTDGGVDYNFECTGNVDVLRDAFLCAYAGLTVILGIHASPSLLPIHPMELFDGVAVSLDQYLEVSKGKVSCLNLPHNVEME